MNEELNKTLKLMWQLDEKRKNGEGLSLEEAITYRENLPIIVEYYNSNSRYWRAIAGEKNIYSN